MAKATSLWVARLFLLLLPLSQVNGDYSRVTTYDLMKCSYGERGSLTATCVNATPSFFKSTLYKFDHLDETLRCLNCTLDIIESNTFDLSGNQIKELDLQNSLITTLRPKAFMGLIFLKSLNISSNKIRSIFPGTFSGTKKIEILDISKNEISILSESGFAELTSLTNLTLRENQIQVIDIKAFDGLNALRNLDLSFNSISAINNSLENLTALEVLNLRHNEIRQLSGNEFFGLTKLYVLDLSENKLLSQFSIAMQPGNQLRRISLAYNQIQELGFYASHLEALEELDLKHNNISLIGSKNNSKIGRNPFESMLNLHWLDVSYNKLTEIETGKFSGLPQLRSLNCSYNKINRVLVTGVFSLQNLHTLDISHNLISDLDYTALISRVPSLAYLRLEDNVLPCDLEKDMEKTFEEDNFKYVLYESVVGSPKCVNKPVTKSTYRHIQDAYVQSRADTISGADVTIFLLISVLIVAVAVLFYMQYLFYKGIVVTGPKRVASTVQLIANENDVKDEEFDIRGA